MLTAYFRKPLSTCTRPSISEKACSETAVKNHCEIFHANDEDYFSKVSFWTTPRKSCGDDRGNVCKDYSEWVQAWTEIKG